MRSAFLTLAFVLVVSPLAAQSIHRATPVDQLLKEYWAAHPQSAHDHSHAHPPMIAELPAVPVTEAVAPAATKTFSIVARQFAYSVTPSPFVVNRGDTVTLDITSSDVNHGFFLESYSTGTGLLFGKNTHRTFTFVANTPGTFTYFCTDASCGTGHGTMDGTFTVNAAAAAPPSITSFTPTSGSTSGGNVVAISGTDFQNNATVKFGDAVAPSVTVNGSTSISALTPAHAVGPVNVTVTNPDGQSVSLGTFTYVAPGPAIASIAPASGSTAGGTAITISGSNFVAGASVTIGGSPATVTALSATSIAATTPVGPIDVASTALRDVVVTNPDGQSATRSGGFTYTLPAPSIASISPAAALPAGGTSLIITGSGFTTALPTSVTFGGVAATSVQVMSPTALAVVAPAHAAGPVDVVVRVGTAQAISSGSFAYQAPSKKRRSVKAH